MSRLTVFLLSLLLISAALAPAAITAAETDYDLDVGGGVETPTKTVDVDGETYKANEFVARDQGETISVAVSAPDDFTVDLVNADDQLVDWADGTGDETVSFNTGSLEPGGYTLRLYDDGQLKDFVPVVINGYHITLEHPDTVTETDNVTVSATVTLTDLSDRPGEVSAVLWNDDVTKEIQLEHVSGNEYTGTVSASGLEYDTYNLHSVAVAAEREMHDEPEPLGISSSYSVVVSEESETGDSGSDSDGDDDGSNDDTDRTDSDENQADGSFENTTETTRNESINGSEEDTNVSANESVAGNETTDLDDTDRNNGTTVGSNGTEATNDTGEDDVISPTNSSETSADYNDERTEDEMPQLGLQAIFGVLLVFGFIRRITQPGGE